MDHVVFTICRMNPPTRGHQKLVKQVLDLADEKKCDHRVFLTRTHDKKNNPLVVDDKLEFARAFFPDANIVDTQNIFTAAKELAEAGYLHATLVVGKDREDSFEMALNRYINHPDPEKDIGLKSLEVIVIPREAHDYSATAARKWATEGNFDNFRDSVPSQDLAVAQKMYKCVRQGLGVQNE
jgi:citrate lyase synthetase